MWTYWRRSQTTIRCSIASEKRDRKRNGYHKLIYQGNQKFIITYYHDKASHTIIIYDRRDDRIPNIWNWAYHLTLYYVCNFLIARYSNLIFLSSRRREIKQKIMTWICKALNIYHYIPIAYSISRKHNNDDTWYTLDRNRTSMHTNNTNIMIHTHRTKIDYRKHRGKPGPSINSNCENYRLIIRFIFWTSWLYY